MVFMHDLSFHVLLKSPVITDSMHRAVYSRGEKLDK